MAGIVERDTGAGSMRAVWALALYKFGHHELRAYARAVRWRVSHEIPDPLTPMDVYRLFYLDFLGVPEVDCKIVEVTGSSLVTRCTNPCPILDLAGRLGRDTREVCRKVSERGCRFFLWGLGSGIRFERDYGTIRPHGPYCEERITLPGQGAKPLPRGAAPPPLPASPSRPRHIAPMGPLRIDGPRERPPPPHDRS